MNLETPERRDYRFVFGLLAGTVVGAGLMMWLAPRSAAELRGRVTDSAKRLGQQASEQLAKASSRAGKAVDDLGRRTDGARNNVADAVARGAHEVARGAHEVERFATAAKSTDHSEA